MSAERGEPAGGGAADGEVAVRPENAELAVAWLREMSADLRGCAILGPDRRVLAASDDPERWAKAGSAFLDAADAAAGEPAESAHVATEDGEAFAVRFDGLAMIAVADRFTLASLMVFDMRTALRDLLEGPAPGGEVG